MQKIISTVILLISFNSLAQNSIVGVKHELGRGYQSSKKQFMNKCLEGDWEKHTAASNARVFMQKRATHDSLLEAMSGWGRVSANFFIVSGSAAANYLKQKKQDQSKHNYQLVKTARTYTKIFKPLGLTNFGKKAYKQGEDFFRKECGDEYVSKKVYGAQFLLNISYNKSASKLVEKASATITFRIFWKKFRKTITLLANSSSSSDAHVKLYALQTGGNEKPLEDIFGSVTEIECDVHNAKSCLDKLDQLEERHKQFNKDILQRENHALMRMGTDRYNFSWLKIWSLEP